VKTNESIKGFPTPRANDLLWEDETMAEMPWTHDYAAALEKAGAEYKFVFLDVFNPG
jgi:hypothetical protein